MCKIEALVKSKLGSDEILSKILENYNQKWKFSGVLDSSLCQWFMENAISLSRKYDYYSTCIRVKVFLFHWAKLRSAGSQSYTYFHEKLRTS